MALVISKYIQPLCAKACRSYSVVNSAGMSVSLMHAKIEILNIKVCKLGRL